MGASPTPRVTLSADDARRLGVEVCLRLGLPAEDADAIADHLLDAELRGTVGLARLLPLADDIARYGVITRPIEIVRESERGALLDGGDRVGMVVAAQATRLAIEKAQRSGIAVVGANRHFFSGVLAYYVELAARAGLVAMAVAAGGVRKGLPKVAPYGAREGRFTTNPITFGFPSEPDPIVWDISTSATSGGELFRRLQTGEPLADGSALDRDGAPTNDPRDAIAGALLTFGGYRGSGLAITIHLLGMLCNLPAFPDDRDGAAFLILAIDPELLGGLDAFKARAAEFAEGVRGSAPAAGSDAVLMPYDRSIRQRERSLRDGVGLDASVHERLVRISLEGVGAPSAAGG